MAERTSLIKFINIEKSFRNVTILKNLSLKIYSDEIIFIIGPSGSGKSTLFKILLGFYKPDSGFIYFGNKNLVYNNNLIRSIVGFVSQENSFYERLTVEENIIFFAKLYGVSKKELEVRLNYLLNLVKLNKYRNIIGEKLSGGMKRRLEFAISLIHNPKILILDEPFTGLDIKIQDDLWKLLYEIKREGVTILISTHILWIAERYADRVVFLHNHKIVKDLNLKDYNYNIDLKKLFYEVIKE